MSYWIGKWQYNVILERKNDNAMSFWIEKITIQCHTGQKKTEEHL